MSYKYKTLANTNWQNDTEVGYTKQSTHSAITFNSTNYCVCISMLAVCWSEGHLLVLISPARVGGSMLFKCGPGHWLLASSCQPFVENICVYLHHCGGGDTQLDSSSKCHCKPHSWRNSVTLTVCITQSGWSYWHNEYWSIVHTDLSNSCKHVYFD